MEQNATFFLARRTVKALPHRWHVTSWRGPSAHALEQYFCAELTRMASPHRAQFFSTRRPFHLHAYEHVARLFAALAGSKNVFPHAAHTLSTTAYGPFFPGGAFAAHFAEQNGHRRLDSTTTSVLPHT